MRSGFRVSILIMKRGYITTGIGITIRIRAITSPQDPVRCNILGYCCKLGERNVRIGQQVLSKAIESQVAPDISWGFLTFQRRLYCASRWRPDFL